MVTQHYRWDFIGLSSYDKPTPETSEKVVDGSTYYEADTSKLYVFYKDTWYEKTATGGGGGGGGSAVKTLTATDFNWNLTLNSATEPYDCVALWLLEPGTYNKTVATGVPVAVHANPGGIETLGMGTYIVATESVNPDTKQILYTTANSSRNWYQQLVTVSNGTSSGTRQFIMNNNVVQTAGTSTTDVMSQNATTSMIFADPTTQRKIKIGANTFTSIGDDAIEIGKESKAKGVSSVAIGSEATADSFASGGMAIGAGTSTFGENAIAIGYSASTNSEKAVALGRGSHANHSFSVALGAGATTSVAGEINVGTGSTYPTRGYNNTNYRLISGVHSPINDHDASTKVYVDSSIANSMIIQPITNFDYNFDSTDPTNTDPDPEDCNSWALWKFPSMGVTFLSYENGIGSDIYLSGGSNPQTISDMMEAEAATAGFIVGAEINGVVNASIYSVAGQMGPFFTDSSTGEPA